MTAKNFIGLLVLAIFIFGWKVSAKDKNYVEDEILVKFKNGTVSAFGVNSAIGTEVLQEFADLKWQVVKLPKGMSVESAISQYQSFAEVETAQPNFYYKLLATPNDTRFSETYGMIKISAPQAWDLSVGSSETVVAIIDTGIKYTHEDLAGNIWKNLGETPNNGQDDDGNGFIDDYYGYDFFFNDPDPNDEFGHGTHVAGTVGAVGNNNLGVAGVNWNVKLMNIKIYNSTGFGTTSTMLINAYNYVRMMKNRGVNIRVTNNSYGGCDEACGYDQATKDALDALGNTNILQVFAAGNNGRNIDSTPFYPASYTSPSILSVGASTQTDDRAGFSNFGTTSVDVAAPGLGILSTVMTSANYGNFSGTSMASPHVAGAAALLSSHNPQLSAMSLKATLMNTVDPISIWSPLAKTGGRINVSQALQNQTSCSFVFSPPAGTFVSSLNGGTFSVNVTTPNNCDYTVSETPNWLTITNGNLNSGSTVVAFNASANTGTTRSATIKIGGQNYLITQRGTDAPISKSLLDFDGDGKSDYFSVQNINNGMLWHILQSSQGYKTVNFGLFSDIPTPADFDGDGKTDVAVFRASNDLATPDFYVLRSSDGGLQGAIWGNLGDLPMINDYDGDGKADYAVTRQENGKISWYILQTSGGFRGLQFGNETDKPLKGDYDGDGKADIAVFRPENNVFYVLQSSNNALSAIQFGLSGIDKTVSGDFDGDGKTDIAVWRTTDGTWYWLKSSNGTLGGIRFGSTGDLPTPGDYDGDGKTDQSVWRGNLTSGAFYTQQSFSGFSAFSWGNAEMKFPANSVFINN